MRYNKRKICLLIGSITMVCLMFGCQLERKPEPKNMREEMSSLEFTYEDNLLGGDQTVSITTKDRTFVWGLWKITFVKTEDPTNTVTYEQDYEGEIRNVKIHLNADGIKKYSKTYSETYKQTLEFVNEK